MEHEAAARLPGPAAAFSGVGERVHVFDQRSHEKISATVVEFRFDLSGLQEREQSGPADADMIGGLMRCEIQGDGGELVPSSLSDLTVCAWHRLSLWN